MTDDLIAEATLRAALLHASAAWGSDADGFLIDRLLDRIEQQAAMERAAIVKWLRGREKYGYSGYPAVAIEAGDHLK